MAQADSQSSEHPVIIVSVGISRITVSARQPIDTSRHCHPFDSDRILPLHLSMHHLVTLLSLETIKYYRLSRDLIWSLWSCARKRERRLWDKQSTGNASYGRIVITMEFVSVHPWHLARIRTSSHTHIRKPVVESGVEGLHAAQQHKLINI